MMSFGSAPLRFYHLSEFNWVIGFQLLLDIFQDLGTECISEYQGHHQMLTCRFCYSETYSFYSYRSFHRDAIILFALLSESKTCSYFHHVYFLGSQFFLERMSLSSPSCGASSNLWIQGLTRSMVYLTSSTCRGPCNLRFFSSDVAYQSLSMYLTLNQSSIVMSNLFAK